MKNESRKSCNCKNKNHDFRVGDIVVLSNEPNAPTHALIMAQKGGPIWGLDSFTICDIPQSSRPRISNWHISTLHLLLIDHIQLHCKESND